MKDVKATAVATAQPLSQEDRKAADYFEDTMKQDLEPYDPLEGLSEILDMGNRMKIDNEIEKELNALVNITAESDSLKEIKDILDELNSISHVFQQQLKIVSEVVASYAPSKSTSHSNGLDSPSIQFWAGKDGDDDLSKGKESTTSGERDGDDEAKQDTTEDIWYKYDQVLSILRRREQDIAILKGEADRVYHAVKL